MRGAQSLRPKQPVKGNPSGPGGSLDERSSRRSIPCSHEGRVGVRAGSGSGRRARRRVRTVALPRVTLDRQTGYGSVYLVEILANDVKQSVTLHDLAGEYDVK